MKVVFLDFNGILDTYENMDVVDPDNLMRLKRKTPLQRSIMKFVALLEKDKKLLEIMPINMI